MNTLWDFFRKQVSPQDQRAIVTSEIQRLFPELYKQHESLLTQDTDSVEAINRIKMHIGNSLGNQKQHLQRYLEDIREHGYQSVNYRHFFELARLLVDQLEEIAYAKEDIFSLLDWHKKKLETEVSDSSAQRKPNLKVSFNIPAKHHAHKHRDKKTGLEHQAVDIAQIIDLIKQVGFGILPEKHDIIFRQLQNLPDISKRRLLAHLTLLNKCSNILDRYKYMTKLRNGRISIKFDYENFYRLGIEKDGTCAGILAKGHEYDDFVKP